MPVTTILIFEQDSVKKDVLVVSCLAIFILLSVSYDMYNNLHFNRILRHTKLVVPELKIRQNLLT